MNIIKKIVYRNLVPLYGRLAKSRNRYINVIYYHDIVSSGGAGAQYTDIDVFKKQMEYISEKGYKTYTFDELSNPENVSFDKKSVLITFDDGWRSNYNQIFEFMREKGIKYNIFLAVGNIGTNPEYLTWEHVKKMHESGIVGFGAHTYSHVSVKDISSLDTNLEFAKANEIIEREAGIKAADFCYPYGQFSSEAEEYLLKNTQYTRIYTSNMDFSYDIDGKIIFGRCSINNDESFNVFKDKLCGNYNAFKTVRGKRK